MIYNKVDHIRKTNKQKKPNSRLQGQTSFKGRGNKLHFLMGGAAKHLWLFVIHPVPPFGHNYLHHSHMQNAHTCPRLLEVPLTYGPTWLCAHSLSSRALGWVQM